MICQPLVIRCSQPQAAGERVSPQIAALRLGKFSTIESNT